MEDERRDDTGLRTLICPHCRQTLPVPQIRAFEKQQLLYLKCDMCGEGITKQQIDDTFREYASGSGESGKCACGAPCDVTGYCPDCFGG